MYRGTILIILFIFMTWGLKLQAQIIDATPVTPVPSDTSQVAFPDSTQSDQVSFPDSMKTNLAPDQKALEKPDHYGTITEIKKIEDYNPKEVLTELKKGKFGHPVNLEKDSTHWKTGGLFAFNVNQGSLTNWAAGGDHFSLSLGTIANFYANYADKRHSWDNNIDLAFGYLKTSSQGMRKSDDKIAVYSRYGFRFSKHWYYSVLVNFRSQFANGYNYPDDSTVVSHFLAPGNVLASLGASYQPADYFSVFLSPLTSRFVIVNDQQLADKGAYGVDPAKYISLGDDYGFFEKRGKRLKYELGAYTSILFNKKIFENINWNTRLEFYSNYLKDPQNIDIHWTSLLSFKVNKFISATLNTELIYDDDIKYITYAKNADGSIQIDPDTGDKVELKKSARIQFKELIGIGLSYQF